MKIIGVIGHTRVAAVDVGRNILKRLCAVNGSFDREPTIVVFLVSETEIQG